MQNKPRFNVVVGDFSEHGSLPLWFGEFQTIEDAHKKLEEVWNMHRKSGFDEERAYVYETRQIMNLSNGSLELRTSSSWIVRMNLVENWYKILIGLLLWLCIFWIGIRPQIVRSQCAAENIHQGTLRTYQDSAYSTCLRLHGLAS